MWSLTGSFTNSKSGFRLAGRLRLHCIVRLIPWMQWRKSKYTQSKCIAQTSKYEVVCVGKLTVRQLGRSDCEANVFPQWTLLKCLFHLRRFYNKGVQTNEDEEANAIKCFDITRVSVLIGLKCHIYVRFFLSYIHVCFLLSYIHVRHAYTSDFVFVQSSARYICPLGLSSCSLSFSIWKRIITTCAPVWTRLLFSPSSVMSVITSCTLTYMARGRLQLILWTPTQSFYGL